VSADDLNRRDERVTSGGHSARDVLERHFREEHGRVDRLIGELPDRLREEWHQIASSLREDIERHVAEQRRLLAAGVEPTGRRWWGIGLFAVGLALQTV
jgi:hypothetical protein